MGISLEDLWVSWLNSDRWRQFAKRGAGARIFRSQAFRSLNGARRYMLTYYRSRRQPALFKDVAAFCLFVGHVKSGGTMLGSLLDAHPEIILADEVDVFRYVAAGFRREQIFHILLKRSRREAMKGRVTARRLTPYSFAVPKQWQGRYRTIRAVGASRAGPSTGQLSRNPDLLSQLRQRMADIDVRLIQVIRNPYDPISLMMIRGERSFENAINHYFDYCQTLVELRQQLPSTNLLTVRYEEILADPRNYLVSACRFLGVETDEEYLDACTSILYEAPERDRDVVDWDNQWIEMVQEQIEGIDFLAGYTFAN